MGTDVASTIPDGVTLDGEGDGGPRRALVVYHRDGLEVVPLQEAKVVVVGRTAPSDLQCRSRRLSRRHASFVLMEGDVWVEDLQSTNGTFLNGKRLTLRTRVRLGDEVTLGSVSVSLHGLDEAWLKPMGLEGHERFQGIVEGELERSRTFERPLAVLMLRALSDRQRPRLAAWVPPLQDLLRMVDRAALYGPDTVEVLLPEADASQAADMARELVEALSAHHPVGCGLAVWPRDGVTAEELVETARAAVLRSNEAQPVVMSRAEPVALGADNEGPVVRDPAMVALFRTIDRVAQSAISVLIVGETGTGKEVIAREIHDRSERRSGPMRVINCGAIPATLLESSLFGHERGAFTGADQRRTGVFEEAHRGTVLLDEIGELSLHAQVALLRVLETRRIQRVGASKEIDVDVRVLAATHRNLEAMCDQGDFRWDLLYRLNPITIAVPPLRQRVSEIRPLVLQFIREANRTNRRSVTGISSETLAHLEGYRWPGNVRELRNTIDRAVVITAGSVIRAEDLPDRVAGQTHGALGDPSSTPTLAVRAEDAAKAGASLDLKGRVRQLEIQLISAALHACAENRTRAAEQLQMPRRTLVYKLRALKIVAGDATATMPTGVGRHGQPLSYAEHVARFEQALIEEALARAGGDRTSAARLLQIQKRTLDQKIERLELD